MGRKALIGLDVVGPQLAQHLERFARAPGSTSDSNCARPTIRRPSLAHSKLRSLVREQAQVAAPFADERAVDRFAKVAGHRLQRGRVGRLEVRQHLIDGAVDRARNRAWP